MAESPEQIADAALRGLCELTSCVRGGVALFDRETDEATLLTARSDSPTQLQTGARTKLSQAFFLSDSPDGQPVVIEDVRNNPHQHPWLEVMAAEGVWCCVSLPLVAQRRVIGALTLGLPNAGQPSPEALEIAADIADRLALAIVNARLREEVLRHAVELEARVAVRTEALRVSEARFRALFEAAPLGMLLANRSGRILQTNQMLGDMLGYAEDELQGMSLPDLAANPVRRNDIGTQLDNLISRQGQFIRLETPLERKDGGLIWACITVARTRGASEAADLAVAMIEDVTDERKTRTALIQAERLAITGRLGASLAHEINNPLQSIIGCLGLAGEILPEGSEAGRYLEVARAELHRVARTVARLRDLQRATESDQLEPTDLNDLLSKLLVLNEPKCGELGIEVVWQPASRLPKLHIMPDRIRQVFLNLILNAMDAMAGGGRLSVRTARIHQPFGARVTVRDTGEGISETMLARLFEPFYSTKNEGLGLGLFTSRSIVEQHGGSIDVRSRPGRGTTFTVWLPAAPSGAEPVSRARSGADG
jgi:PAS domain S-box-containing protein